MTKVLLRRSPYLVFRYRKRQLFVHNYLTRVTVSAKPFLLELLNLFEQPTDASRATAAFPDHSPSSVLKAVENLLSLTLLEPFSASARQLERTMQTWEPWDIDARFFHFASKDVRYGLPEQMAERDEARKLRSPSPPAFKRYPGAAQVTLPPAKVDLTNKLTDVLFNRRTQRDFDGKTISLVELATLLKLTWGVSKFVDSPTFGRMPLKTSPSGGARHPIEVYVAAHNVLGLRQGLYHYAPDRHRLHVIRQGNVKQHAERYCAGQWWTRDAAALFWMTAVFERSMWRYDYSRALRAIYIEAGHLCQTFCLTATALNLAPFCTIAVADSLIERDLGLDGIRESVLYVAAAGHVR